MPKVVENRWLERNPEMKGSTYEQTYQNETYVGEIVEYENTDHRKHTSVFNSNLHVHLK
jgi:hypothetical protein